MTDFQWLVVVVVGLYASECVYWVRRGSVVFRTLFLRDFAVVHPSPGLGSTGAGMVILNPLPPMGTAFVLNQWPISLTAEAVVSYVPQVINGNERPMQMGCHVRFADIKKISCDGTTLLVNGEPFARLNGEILAGHWAVLLARLSALPEGERSAAIDGALAGAMNVRAVRRRVRRFRRQARWVRVYSYVVMATLAGVLAAIGLPGFRPWLLVAIAALFFSLMLAAMAFFEAHKRLFRDAGGLRWRKTLTMFLTPTVSIRACDALSRDLLAGFHPLAAALVLCGEGERRAFSRRVLLDLDHPMQPGFPSDDAGVREVIVDFHGRLRGAVHGLLSGAGEDIAALTAPPAADDATCRGYCPRCDSQFVISEGVCSHCGDMAICRLPEGAGVPS